MTAYEAGFNDGEHAAWSDRKAGRPRRIRPQGELTPYARGWWDGYTPRSLHWSLTKPVEPARSEPVEPQ